MTEPIKLTEDDIQVRFISGASRKIIINSNANFYLKGEKYDYSNESIVDKRHKQLKQQILDDSQNIQRVDDLMAELGMIT
ncbi:MAG: hypothetical protein IIA82_07660 [Thaumarchaeota archaeon]|nr:hypothetical protein [Nitrososphaerota archaeon]